MTRQTHFKSKAELNQVITAVADLVEGWGLAPNEWMLGKGASLAVAGMLNHQEVERDLTIYVLRDRLPWSSSADGRSRSTVAPAGSPFAKAHHELEKQLGCGIDLTPIPDVASAATWLTKTDFYTVNDRSINVESPQKYVARRIVFCEQELALPIEEARNTYFVDRRRYAARMGEYSRVRLWATEYDQSLVARVDRLIQLFEQLIRRLYPELFTLESGFDAALIRGQSTSGAKIVTGRVAVVQPHDQPATDRVLVFSHFSPRDNLLAQNARAIITDGGGITSHAAILCRELGIPCIVGTKIATKVLKDGDLVEVDATSGIIRKIN